MAKGRFSENISIGKFDILANRAYAKALLGQPLRTHAAGPRITWYYGPPTLRVSDDGGPWDASKTFDTDRG